MIVNKQQFIHHPICRWLFTNSRNYVTNRRKIMQSSKGNVLCAYYQIRGAKIFNDGYAIVSSTKETLICSALVGIFIGLSVNWAYAAEFFGVKITVREEPASRSRLDTSLFDPYGDEALELFRMDKKTYYEYKAEVAKPPTDENENTSETTAQLKSSNDEVNLKMN